MHRALLLCFALVAARAMATTIIELEARTDTISASVATENGGESAYWIYGPKRGPRVLLVMGLAFNHFAWESTVIDLVENHGCRVLALDNRGVGKSKSTAGNYSTLMLARDTRAVLADAKWWPAEGMEKNARYQPIHIAGLSMGGMISQELALMYPEGVASLALVATHAGGSLLEIRPALRALEVMALMKLKLVGDLGSDKELGYWAKLLYTDMYIASRESVLLDQLRIMFDVGGRITNDGFSGQLDAIFAHDTMSRLPALKGRFPISIFAGTEDAMIPYKNSLRMATVLDCPLYIAQGAGHGLCNDDSAGERWFQIKFWQHMEAAIK